MPVPSFHGSPTDPDGRAGFPALPLLSFRQPPPCQFWQWHAWTYTYTYGSGYLYVALLCWPLAWWPGPCLSTLYINTGFSLFGDQEHLYDVQWQWQTHHHYKWLSAERATIWSLRWHHQLHQLRLCMHGRIFMFWWGMHSAAKPGISTNQLESFGLIYWPITGTYWQWLVNGLQLLMPNLVALNNEIRR